MRLGDSYREIEYRAGVVNFYKDGVVQAVTFAYLVYW